MERLTESPIGFIGAGYLVLCSKEEQSSFTIPRPR